MNVGTSHLTRHLAWDACRNVRDLGGYETVDGGQTRWRALLRADNLCRLTPQGQAAQDRTGMVVALLLAIAGVPHATIAADYAASADYLQPLYTEVLATGPQDPIARERLAARLAARPETMLAVLSHLNAQYGGVH